MPLVSVIIPTYQRAATLLPALESVFAQTWTDYEIIVADDGSTDNTAEILEPFRDRIVYSYESNQGASAARNRGARIARGEFLAFLDSDDLWEPRKLELQMPLLEQQPEIGWVYCDMDYFGNEKRFKTSSFVGHPPARGWILKHMYLHGCPMHSPTLVVKKQLFEASGAYDERLRAYEDHDLYFRLAGLAPADYTDQVLVHCRREGRSQAPLARAKDMNTLLLAKRRGLAESPELRSQFTPREFHLGFVTSINQTAVAYAIEGDNCRARELLQEVLGHEPWWIKPRLYQWGLRFPKLFHAIRNMLVKTKSWLR